MKKGQSLKQQIIYIFTSTSLIVACIICSYVYLKAHNYTRNTLENNYRSSADLQYNDMESKIDSYCSYSYILSRNPNLINMLLNPYDLYDIVIALNSDIEPTIQFVLDSSDAIKKITIYTDESEHEIPSKYFQDVHVVQNSKWYQEMMNHDGTRLMSENNKLFIISPIRNYHSQRIETGFVRLDIDLETFSNEISSNHQDLDFILYDESGTELISTASNLQSEEYIKLNENSLYGTEITSAFYIHKSLLHIPILEMLLPIIVVLMAFLLFSYVFVRLINKIIFLRLERIMEQINCIDVDNFNIKIEDDKNDEISKLANCINEMSEKINHLFIELGETKDREKRAELEYLRAKIDPHFLYNIMDTINWIAIDGDTELICQIVHELSIFYRTNLNYGKTINTLYNEIENVKAYLNLQTIATSQGFDVEYKIDEQLLNYETCDFILQPLAENAINHGIKPLKDRRGFITVELYEMDDTLHLLVTDNGVGLSKATRSVSKFKKTNYGLKNINERIRLTFGDKYGVALTPAANGVGTMAKITLPKQKSSPN